MKKYKSSDLTHKRAEVLKEARENGVIIQELRTNGEVIGELVLIEVDMLPLVNSAWDIDIMNGKG